jgi:selenocysteine lyase/cysteine desulfurase
MILSDIRRLTPATENYAYFQTSGFSPKPEPVIDEVIRWHRFVSQGPALPEVYSRMNAILETTRTKVAQSLNVHADEIMLSANATVGINIIAHGIDWKTGDNVILSTHEHPGNRIPWYNLANRYGLQLRFLTISNDMEQMLDELPRLIDDQTRLVSISHVSRRTGIRLPAAEFTAIAHSRSVPVLFDGAQSYGAIPLDLSALNCDFYTFSGHKYIMAPQGTGGCYIRKDRIKWVKPSWIGSHSQKTMDLTGHLTLLDDAKRFEFGTRNLADQAGFGKALELWSEIGWNNVFSYIKNYTDRLKRALLNIPEVIIETPLGYETSSGIVTFSLPGYSSAGLSASLLEHERILVSSLEHDTSMVRVSTHVFNTDEEIDRLVSGITRILRSGY